MVLGREVYSVLTLFLPVFVNLPKVNMLLIDYSELTN